MCSQNSSPPSTLPGSGLLGSANGAWPCWVVPSVQQNLGQPTGGGDSTRGKGASMSPGALFAHPKMPLYSPQDAVS